MADTRKFVLPGQPPGTYESSSPLLASWGCWGALCASPRESLENSVDFDFLAVSFPYGYGCVFVTRWRRVVLCRSRTSHLKCLHLKKAVRLVLLCSCSPRKISRSFCS